MGRDLAGLLIDFFFHVVTEAPVLKDRNFPYTVPKMLSTYLELIGTD